MYKCVLIKVFVDLLALTEALHVIKSIIFSSRELKS